MQDIEDKAYFSGKGVACVLTPCSARKSKLLEAPLSASTITAGQQAAVARQWRRKLLAGKPVARGGDLYSGSAFRRVRKVGIDLGASVWIISAGLGLIRSSGLVPSYDLTLSSHSPESLPGRVTGPFSYPQWWADIQQGPFACPLSAIGEDEEGGRILLCLTKPYARLLGPALAELPGATLDRLRIFGPGIGASLPESLRSRVLVYGARLDLISPGIQLDAGARALEHFAKLTRNQPLTDVTGDQALVDCALSPYQPPEMVERGRLDDSSLREHVRPWAAQGISVRVALRRLRDMSLISCEEKRFRRIYEEAQP